MILCLKTRESRSPPGLPIARKHSLTISQHNTPTQNAPSVKTAGGVLRSKAGKSRRTRDRQVMPGAGTPNTGNNGRKRLRHRIVVQLCRGSRGSPLREMQTLIQACRSAYQSARTPEAASAALQSATHQRSNPRINRRRLRPTLRFNPRPPLCYDIDVNGKQFGFSLGSYISGAGRKQQ
jgi:hypothetical protein